LTLIGYVRPCDGSVVAGRIPFTIKVGSAARPHYDRMRAGADEDLIGKNVELAGEYKLLGQFAAKVLNGCALE
jgi:hypothetical protein